MSDDDKGMTTTQQHGAGQALVSTQETASSFVAAQGRAMIEARFTVALRFPRNEDEVRQKVLKECKRPSFCNVAIYKKPVGGKIMEGLSIRAIECALRLSRNIDVQTPTIYDDREKRIVRVAIVDLESNLTYSNDITIEKAVERKKVKEGQTVLRSRINSYGDMVHLVEAAEDEVQIKQAALISKSIRTNGQRLIPGDLVDEMLFVIRQTAADADKKDPDQARRNVYDFMATLGVQMADLAKWLGHPGASLTPRELDDLRGIARAIKDGETTWVAVMETKGSEPPPKGSKLADVIKPVTKEDEPKLTAQMIHDAIAFAEDLTSLAEADAMIDKVPKKEQQPLRDLVVVMRGKLTAE